MNLRNCIKPVRGKLRKAKREIPVISRIIFNKTFRLLFPIRSRANSDGKTRLHLGSGAIDHPQFINIDGYPHPTVHYVQRIDRLKQFDGQSVDLIYASHCLEHFRYNDTKTVLEEWFRVIKPGGILRISVPDFDCLVKIYSDNGNDPDTILPQLMGGQNNKYNFHYTALNEVNLTRLLKVVGFRDVRLWTPDQDEFATFDDFSRYQKEVNGKKYEISLNIEAVK